MAIQYVLDRRTLPLHRIATITAGCCDNDQGWDEGYDYDTNRGTGYGYLTPADLSTASRIRLPRTGLAVCGCMTNFGSAHEAGFNMAFCDGAVQMMSYNIDPTIHMQLGHRADGEPTDNVEDRGQVVLGAVSREVPYCRGYFSRPLR